MIRRQSETKLLIMTDEGLFICSVCGCRERFVVEGVAKRDDYRCINASCRSMTRQRDLAQLILDDYCRGAALSLNDAMKQSLLNEINIYEVGMQGPVGRRISKLPGYVNSYFWEDVRRGEYKDGIRCEDIRRLTFGDDSFDLVISMEVLEHVFDVPAAVSEIARVLKPGGEHIFTIPVRYPFPERTTERAKMSKDKVVHLEEPRYHIAGDQSKSLVVNDFGQDLIELHATYNLRLSVVRRSAPMELPAQNATFVARKVGTFR